VAVPRGGALQSLARVFRLSVSPGAAAAYIRMNLDIDVCDVLPLIRVPTLVMHRKEGGAWDIRIGGTRSARDWPAAYACVGRDECLELFVCPLAERPLGRGAVSPWP